MALENNLVEIALADLKMAELALGTVNDEIMQNMAAYHVQQAIEKCLKALIIEKRGFGNTGHDINSLAIEAQNLGITVPGWVVDNAYEVSRWATTIRYNSNFKTNRDKIVAICNLTKKWISTI